MNFSKLEILDSFSEGESTTSFFGQILDFTLLFLSSSYLENKLFSSNAYN